MSLARRARARRRWHGPNRFDQAIHLGQGYYWPRSAARPGGSHLNTTTLDGPVRCDQLADQADLDGAGGDSATDLDFVAERVWRNRVTVAVDLDEQQHVTDAPLALRSPATAAVALIVHIGLMTLRPASTPCPAAS